MPELAPVDKRLVQIERAQERLEKAEARVAEARLSFFGAIRDAHADGLSLTRIGEHLKISRQRVKQLLDRAPH